MVKLIKWFGKMASGKIFLTALAFGLCSMLLMLARFYLPTVGSPLVTDPREIPALLGAALTGPLGGLLIGLMAGATEPTTGLITGVTEPAYGLKMLSMLSHGLAGIWIGWSYKHLACRWRALWKFGLAWLALVMVYYVLLFLPGVIIAGLFPELVSPIRPIRPDSWQTFWVLIQNALPEICITVLLTFMVWALLPAKYRQPLW